MIGFAAAFTEFVIATFVPIYVGMFLLVAVSNGTHVQTRYLSAYALGLLFWFFFDTLNDAAQLDVNQGFSFELDHIGLVAAFILCFLVFTLLGGWLSSKGWNDSGKNTAPFLIAVLVALAMGIHGIGEGVGFGGLAAGTQASTTLDAIGGISGGIAYVLHKLLESTIVIAVFIALARTNGLPIRKQLWQTVLIGLMFGIPSAAGEVAGYSVALDSTWFYAMGAGAALFVVLQVVRPIFAANKKEEITYSQWVRISGAMLLGFLLLYVAALLHS
jgi:hypothetical protein